MIGVLEPWALQRTKIVAVFYWKPENIGAFPSQFLSPIATLHPSTTPFFLSPFETRSVTLPTNFTPRTTRNAPLPVVFVRPPTACVLPTRISMASLPPSGLFPICRRPQPFSSLHPRTLRDAFSTPARPVRTLSIPNATYVHASRVDGTGYSTA